MILPDLNLLVYAYNADAPEHRRAKAWCLRAS
jgi:predicted nucleic acid-binding protein